MRVRRFAITVLGLASLGVTSQACDDDTSAPPIVLPKAGVSLPEGGSNPSPDAGQDAGHDAAPITARLTLTASQTTVTTEGTTTLTATVEDGTTSSVDFLEGTTVIATDPEAPFTASLALTFAQNGTKTYVARATVGGQVLTSDPVTITVNVPANGVFVDPANGLDTADGSQATPFKTIAKARTAISAGQTIYLKDGTYDATNQTNLQTSFNQRQFVRGLSPGGAKIVMGPSGVAVAFAFLAGGGISDVSLEGAGTGVFGNSGELEVTNVALSGFATPLTLRGSVVATVDQSRPGLRTNVPANCFACLALVEDEAKVTYRGQTFENYAGDGPFVRGNSTFTAENITLRNHRGTGIRLWDSAHLVLRNSVIDRTGRATGNRNEDAAINAGAQNAAPPLTTSIELESSSIIGSPGAGIYLLHYNAAFTHTVKLTASHLDGNTGPGFISTEPVSEHPDASLVVTLAGGTTVDDNDGGGLTIPRGAVDITGGSISKNTGKGLEVASATLKNTLVVRGATFDANTGDAIVFNGAAATSSLDLGNAVAGGLVFKGIPAPAVAVRLDALAFTANAKGNTWMPNEQGANATGQYTSATTLTSATLAGRNAGVAAGSSLVVF